MPTVLPDAAVRARLNAAVLDAVIIGGITRLIVGALKQPALSADAIVLIFGLQFVYFFALELGGGQTIGKRVMHVRVVRVDGSRARMRECAIRSGMRFLDALPLLYTSGLISLIRTGRNRRQRMGDVVAGTTVVLDGGGRALRTPRWMLPLAAMVACFVSIGVIVLSVQARHHRPSFANLNVPGFPGDNRQEPALGSWHGIGTITFSQGYADDVPGVRFIRPWQISRSCSRGFCSLMLTRWLGDGSSVAATLVSHRDGWHARFPARVYMCNEIDGQPITWQQRSVWVVRFVEGGRIAEAHERNLSYAPRCGWGTDRIEWVARRD